MRRKARVLVVDDEELLCLSLMDWLRKDGYQADVASNAENALEKLQCTTYDLLLVDIVMPGMSGIEFLQRLREDDPDIPVIMMTAHGSIDSAVEAMKKGASDYLQKPFAPKQLGIRMRQVEQRQKLFDERQRCEQRLDYLSSSHELLAISDSMKAVIDLIEDVAPTNTNVMIYGESGTGKEVVAREIHRKSQQKDGPFIAVNFGAFPESLAESEIFGYEKGAFTGANKMKRGLIELAQGGTLFLDEIGEACPKIQVDLLRVLQERTFLRLGGTEPRDVDVRIISATNRDPEKAIQEGTFRQDLYYRLNVIRIFTPPLRERREDIPPLAQKFLKEFSGELKKRINKITPEAMELLKSHSWPGNVRELRNAIERAVVVAKESRIFPKHLPIFLKEGQLGQENASLVAVERDHIARKLREYSWNISKTAETLGIDRSTLYAKIKKFSLSRG